MTNGICEIIVGNMDVDSNKGVVVGHACGDANAYVFCAPFVTTMFSLLFILQIVVQSFYVLLCQQKVLCFYIFSQSNQAYNMTQFDRISFMTTITTI